MTTKETGEPAFPRNYDADGHNGMTLRDYFAAKVLVPALTGAVFPTPEDVTKGCAMLAKFAYQMADAMLEARK